MHRYPLISALKLSATLYVIISLATCRNMHTTDKVVGYQGEVFTIERPRARKLTAVHAAQFGQDAANVEGLTNEMNKFE